MKPFNILIYSNIKVLPLHLEYMLNKNIGKNVGVFFSNILVTHIVRNLFFLRDIKHFIVVIILVFGYMDLLKIRRCLCSESTCLIGNNSRNVQLVKIGYQHVP